MDPTPSHIARPATPANPFVIAGLFAVAGFAVGCAGWTFSIGIVVGAVAACLALIVALSLRDVIGRSRRTATATLFALAAAMATPIVKAPFVGLSVCQTIVALACLMFSALCVRYAVGLLISTKQQASASDIADAA